MELLKLDPEVLEATATIIENYCNRQKNIMDAYLSRTSSLSSEWSDDQTFGSLISEITVLKNTVIGIMDEILSTYPRYFRGKADQIRNRPRM